MCESIVNRNLFKVELSKDEIDPERIVEIEKQIRGKFDVSDEELSYLIYIGTTSNSAYDPNQPNINILYKDGTIQNISEAADQLNISVLTTPVVKHYLCFPK